MNFKLLGIVAIVCAPFLYIDFLTSPQNSRTWQTGFYGFIYMAGWLCSLVALHRMQILGRTKWARLAFTVQFTLLALAQCWNLWLMTSIPQNHVLFTVLDICWPLSNIWMLVIGITTLRAKVLQGWQRYVPLLVGLWFPLMIVPAITIGGTTNIAGPYCAIAFALLGFVVFNAKDEKRIVSRTALA